ncbi:MAG: Phosphoribosylformimino-5-aminoimidazole carboxamide ribotide isomerase [uncultured Solirubrobacteraceae bacterium]|uniref:1-(5-phosphoribosyl)-5-[(5-phosphoribosylamino)methylideneamino] imidazole-4-carboxamide isomerase n=1 Tax=uncultured Solirubrobacteraceae bacterium TaxID=1162706 RepID=A0A6J4RBV4_9ACTN|nr:MAG: Phosphoribosylformimino-5-aminoimidazole carboxamide ribotide isomerase [uncultured Solirubrobacteraceae bacterium]
MNLYPAIDILENRAVRLRQGRFEDKTVYHDDPLDAARSWIDAGARRLHVVDLDGAKSGTPSALGHLERIVSETGVAVQYGGGLRTAAAVADALAAGARRAVIGTAAFGDSQFLDEVLEAHGDRVAIAVDVRRGMISTAGWTHTTELPAIEALGALAERGARSFIYTSVDRDGELGGIDLDEVGRVADAVRGSFIYSGGIGTLDDLRGLAALQQSNLEGVIVGKALYERRFTIAQADEVLGAAS